MTEVVLAHGGNRAELLLCRPLFAAALEALVGHAVTIRCCAGDADLLADLAAPHCRIAEAPLANTPHGAPIDLLALAPRGAVTVPVGLGGDGPVPCYQWGEALADLRAALQARGLPAPPAALDERVPMLDLPGVPVLPPRPRPAVYLDLQRGPASACHFVFDVARLGEALPEVDFLCTAEPGIDHPALVRLDPHDWRRLQAESHRAAVLVGRTLWPFALTLTEANRDKPKALCGWDARVHAPFWDYPGNPIELLATMDDLVDFLLANVAAAVAP